MTRFHVINFGCRANQADGSAIERQFVRLGCAQSGDPAASEIVVLNSCTVTSGADYSLRNAARRIRRENPSARIVVTGCYAQRSPGEVAAIPGVDVVVGNSHKAEIASVASGFLPLHTLGSKPAIHHRDIFDQSEFLDYHFGNSTEDSTCVDSASDRTRPNLKIQDGCNNRCSFCIIPFVRGASRSKTQRSVIDNIDSLCAAGYKEIVLSGINLGQYGREFPSENGEPKRHRFLNLIRAILDKTPVERLRLSSVEPMDFSDDLLALMASTTRIAHHVHAPMQSGSDLILRRMHRKYRATHYRQRIEAAHRLMPNAAYGADVMTGFPGESADDFDATRRLIEELPFTYLHVFPYSRRPGTPADRYANQVHGSVVRERTRILRELSDKMNAEFRARQIGRVLDVVTLERGASSDATPALSGNFLPVAIENAQIAPRTRLAVKITSVAGNRLVGRNT